MQERPLMATDLYNNNTKEEEEDETEMKLAISNLVQNSKQVKGLWGIAWRGKLTNKPSIVNIVLIANLKVTELSTINHSLTAQEFIPIKTVKCWYIDKEIELGIQIQTQIF